MKNFNFKFLGLAAIAASLLVSSCVPTDTTSTVEVSTDDNTKAKFGEVGAIEFEHVQTNEYVGHLQDVEVGVVTIDGEKYVVASSDAGVAITKK